MVFKIKRIMRNSLLNRIHFRYPLSLCLIVFSVVFIAMGCKPDEYKKQLTPSVDTLFMQSGEVAMLSLTNQSDQLCSFIFDKMPNWFYYDCYGRRILPGETKNIECFSYIITDAPLYGTVLINSTFGTLSLVVVCYPAMEFSYEIPNELHFPLDVDTQKITLENTGNVELSYSVTTFSPAISITQSSGIVDAYLHTNIGVSVDREAIREELDKLYLNVVVNGEINTVRLLVDME